MRLSQPALSCSCRAHTRVLHKFRPSILPGTVCIYQLFPILLHDVYVLYHAAKTSVQHILLSKILVQLILFPFGDFYWKNTKPLLKLLP